MFEIGNIVMHPSAGVCCIEDIREEKLTDKKRMYYIMHPLSDQKKSTLYVPVDTDKLRLRKLMSKEEIIEMYLNIVFLGNHLCYQTFRNGRY